MAVDFKNLDKVILKWEKNFDKSSLAARKKSGSVFLDSVVDGTPQDTGETVSNWRVGRDVAPQGVIPAYFPGKKGSRVKANKIATKSLGKKQIRALRRVQNLVIANNSVVVGLLEAGFSQQAPRGNIVAMAVAKALKTYKGIDSWLDGTANNLDKGI